MKDIIIEKIKEEKKDLEQAWKGYHAEEDSFYQDLYLADIEDALDEIGRLERLLVEPVELENKLPL